MRLSRFVVAAALAISAACGGSDGSTPTVVVPTAAKDTVSTLPQDFVPNLLTVPVGSTVVFAFGGGIPHNVIFDHSVAGAPSDIQIATNVFTARTFNARGSFRYDCTVHPGMRGEVLVQ